MHKTPNAYLCWLGSVNSGKPPWSCKLPPGCGKRGCSSNGGRNRRSRCRPPGEAGGRGVGRRGEKRKTSLNAKYRLRLHRRHTASEAVDEPTYLNDIWFPAACRGRRQRPRVGIDVPGGCVGGVFVREGVLCTMMRACALALWAACETELNFPPPRKRGRQRRKHRKTSKDTCAGNHVAEGMVEIPGV